MNYFSVVKFTIFLLFFSTVVMVAEDLNYSQNTNLTLQLKNVSVKDVLKEIESKSEFIFIFRDDIVDLDRKVSINVKNRNIHFILNELFKSTENRYEVLDRQVVIMKKEPSELNDNRPDVDVLQQGVTISGTVTDKSGEPIPGVNIVEKGTSNGTVTNLDGQYTLRVSDKATVVFSFMGFTAQEFKIGDQRTINVTLAEEIKSIEEVVVVGYGLQKKESIVGSIVQASNEEIMKSGNVTDVKQALSGRLPGLITTLSTGEPGGTGVGNSATSIFIRGRNSWNNSQPLILVDGMERGIDNIDMSEIESISLLKDASATAVFGVKGAQGVLLITTKRGQNSRPTLSFSYDATALMISKLPDKLDSYDALRLRNESIERDVSMNETLWTNYTPMEIMRRYRERDYPEYEYLYPNVDWAKAMFKDVGWSHRASLNIRGGTNFVKYFGSLSYLNEGDMLRKYDNGKGYNPSYGFNRFNFRSNFDFNLTKTTVFKINLAGYFSQKNTNRSWNYTENAVNPLMWSAAYRMPPDLYVVQFPDGAWGWSTRATADLQNPVALANNLGVWERKTTALNVDFTLDQKLDFITKGLSISAAFFYDNSIQTVGGIDDITNHVRPETGGNTLLKIVDPGLYTYPNQPVSEFTTLAFFNPVNEYDWVVRPWTRETEAVAAIDKWNTGIPITRRMAYQAQLNYSRKFGVHNVGATGVFKREEYANGSEFPHYREDWIFRATYDYDSRYFLEANGAYNGSEKFSPDYRFDFFPSFGVSWYLSNEKFFKVDWVNKLKLRYTLGWAGDDSAGPRFLYLAQYGYGGSARLQSYGGRVNGVDQLSPYSFYRETGVANPDAHWELAKKTNYGLELGLWKDLLSVNFDYFTDNRTDILIVSRSSVPPYFGATAPATNLGKVDAKGFEVTVNLNKTTSYGLDYWATATVTNTRNKIIFRDDPELQIDYMKSAGYPIGQTRTQVRTDFYQNWDDVYASVQQQTNNSQKIPGFYDIVDFNGDGVISNEDNIPYGYPDVPENTYNLTLGAGYKGFSVTLQFYGVNNVTRQANQNDYYQNQSILFGHARDFWSKDNPNATSFLPRYQTTGSFYGNYFFYDGSYIRLKTAEIAYLIPKSVMAKLHISSLKFFINGNNLWLWTRLPDDREDTWNGGSTIDGAYPTLKRINFGFNVTF